MDNYTDNTMIAGLLASIIFLTFGLQINQAMGCSDIVDFYIHRNSRPAYDKSCKYTITYIPDNMVEMRIPRSTYDRFAKEYEDLGMLPPYPKRNDKKTAFPADFHRKKYSGRGI